MVGVCKSWEDYVWAYYKAMTDTMVEQELRNCPTLLTRNRPECNNDVIPLPESYWDQKILLAEPADIFDKVLAVSNEVCERRQPNSVRYMSFCIYPQQNIDLKSLTLAIAHTYQAHQSIFKYSLNKRSQCSEKTANMVRRSILQTM